MLLPGLIAAGMLSSVLKKGRSPPFAGRGRLPPDAGAVARQATEVMGGSRGRHPGALANFSLTPLDSPAVHRALAAAPSGAVCEVPFGIGDGLGTRQGSQDRSALFYATHDHPRQLPIGVRVTGDGRELYRFP